MAVEEHLKLKSSQLGELVYNLRHKVVAKSLVVA